MTPQGLRFLERWWLRGGVFLLPLGFSFQTWDSWVLPKILLARVLLLGLLALELLRAVAAGRFGVRRTSLDVPVLLFLASAAVSTALAYNINAAVFGTYSRYDGLLTTATYVALFWLAVQCLDGPDDARGLLRALLASGYTFGLFAIAGAVVATLNGGGALPVSATIGNSNVAGTFLAMLMPLALYEVFDASSWSGRIVALNVVLVVGTTLLLTLSRSSWLGATVGVIVLAAGWRRLVPRLAPMAALVAAAAAVVMGGAGPTINRRLASIVQPADWGSRPHIWRDTLDMVASRPLFGYGPDNFGLVYPNYQTGAWEISGTGSVLQIDKAHAETLQVAATQGVVGLAAYVFILFALVRSFWRSGRDELSVALFAAVVAYQVTLQLNFTQVAAAIPFWIMVAAAAVVWERPSERYIATVPAGRETRAVIVSAGLVPAAVLATVLVAFPYLADASLRVAVESDFVGHGPDAIHAAQRAAQLVPYESVYQVEIGNLAFERGAWWDARSAYQLAATLGSYNPYLFRNLALVDINLGRREDALAAAEQALVLDRFDPATRALVDQLREDARTP